MHHTIDVKNLIFSYPDGRQALNGVNLYIAPGEKVALVGPNGAGKSTLLLHLNGILRGEGEVCVCDQPVTDDNLRQVRASVGLVFQDPDDQLFSPTVFDEAVGMSACRDRVSHHLSGGEKKRVAIATVLSMDPEILVLDEPTAGLDPRARRGLIELLRELPQTMLVSTHDLAMVKELFERTIVIDGGVVVGDGPTDEIMADPKFLAQHGLEAA